MRDWEKPVRTSFYNALDGAVLLSSTPIPVFQEQVREDSPEDLYIVIAGATATDGSTFPKWETDVFLIVEAVQIAQANTGDEVDDMVDQIKSTLLPTRLTMGIAQPSGFEITEMRLESEHTMPIAQTDNGYIKRKILRFGFHITDNN